LDPEHDLASVPTFSRLEHQVDRKDLYRLTTALVDHFIASSPEPPAAIVLDLYHSDDPTHGQQEFAFYNNYYKNYYYMSLFIFEGTSHALVTAYLRPGTRPTGAENAMILVRLAAPVIHEARRLHQQRVALAQARGEAPPASSRLYEEFTAAALSWAQRWRVVLKAEVMSAGDNPRFVVTSLDAPTPQMVYEDLYCARGNCENDIKALKCDLHSERTSVTTFLAKAMRLILACAAYALHHALRTSTLPHTALAQAQPSTVNPHPLQNRHANQTVQRSHPPPSAQFLSCQSALTAGHHPAIRCP